jgi:hypothetical protein
LIRDQQALVVGGGELLQRIVERARRLPPSFLDPVKVAIGADLAVQHLDVNTVAIHVLEPRGRIAVTGTPPRLMIELDPCAAGARGQFFLMAPLLGDRRVVFVVILPRQVLLDVVVSGFDVRVGGNQAFHGSFSFCSRLPITSRVVLRRD